MTHHLFYDAKKFKKFIIFLVSGDTHTDISNFFKRHFSNFIAFAASHQPYLPHCHTYAPARYTQKICIKMYRLFKQHHLIHKQSSQKKKSCYLFFLCVWFRNHKQRDETVFFASIQMLRYLARRGVLFGAKWIQFKSYCKPLSIHFFPANFFFSHST